MAVKAKRKVEKLRRQLEKEEKRAAKAEAKAFKTELEAHPEAYEKAESKDAKKRKRSDSGESCNAKVADTNTIKPEEQNRIALDGADIKVESDTQAPKENIVAAGTHEIGSNGALHESREAHSPSGPLTPTSQPRAPDEDVDAKILSINHDGHPGGPDEDSCKAVGFSNEAVDVGIERTIQESKLSVSDSSSESSSTDSEDLISSSGSSSSASDSDEDTPQQTSSKRNGPERVAPPKRERSNQICKDFLKSGRCRRGDNCRFRHELPERGSRAAGRREDKKTQERTERVSLHQRVSGGGYLSFDRG